MLPGTRSKACHGAENATNPIFLIPSFVVLSYISGVIPFCVIIYVFEPLIIAEPSVASTTSVIFPVHSLSEMPMNKVFVSVFNRGGSEIIPGTAARPDEV